MGKPKKEKNVEFEPIAVNFKPVGTSKILSEEVILNMEEFEAIRLKDFMGLEQKKSAKSMKISQPTFHRLLLSARRKIGGAIVQGKAIRIEGGVYKIHKKEREESKMSKGTGLLCICPTCKHTEPKKTSLPCFAIKCPICEIAMRRCDK